MQDEHVDRRSFLKVMGAVGMSSSLLPEAALGLHPASAHILEQAAGAGPEAATKPKYSIKFGVIGLDHYHIMGMTAAVIRGGGELVSFYSTCPRPSPISRSCIPMPSWQRARTRFWTTLRSS